ncbi:hypothetical protein AG0111_0g7592 [Alternaria gaisen]|uniref:Uncharacterized protein n=1 Tax=Alternaria gaisen TaxID=167740 RepID=A0ACB6FI47_9PLEO|nr:hypothetical protein AG0111_0g7592 [Alternaria gaisen]
MENCIAISALPKKLNLYFVYHAKFFTTKGDCSTKPLNCPITVTENIWEYGMFRSDTCIFEKSHMHPVNTSTITVCWDSICGPEEETICGIYCSQYVRCIATLRHCHGACQNTFGVGHMDADVAATHGIVTDEVIGGQYYFNAENRLFWT